MTLPSSSSSGSLPTSPAKPALRPIEDAYPLTRMQQALLVRCLAHPDQPLYMGQWWAVLQGKLDEQAFAQAWQNAVDRHTALRSGFHWDIKANPFQVVHRQANLPVSRQDWSEEADWRARLDAFLAQDRAQPFDLKKPPLMRIALVRLAADRHLVVWTRHHLTVDGWSLGIILSEVFAHYKARLGGPALQQPPAPAFRSYVDWEQSNPSSGAPDHWRSVLAVHPLDEETLEGKPRATSATAPDIDTVALHLPASAASRLEALARACRVTVNTTVQGAWAIVESRLSNRDTVLFGAVETSRPPHLAQDGSELVGVQVQIQPILARIDQTPLAAWLEGLQAAAVAARQAGAIGMDEFRALLGMPGDRLPFDSLVGFQNYPLDEAGAFKGCGLALEESGDVTLPDMPLNLMVEAHAGGLRLLLMFDRRRGDEAQARLRLEMLREVLTRLPESLQSPVAAIDALPAATAAALLSPSEEAASPPGADRGVVQAILEHAANQPQATAVVQGAQRLDYAGLAATAIAIADRLAAQGIGPGARIGLHLERSPLAIAAILGTMLRGASYVPLDMESPEERKQFIAAEAEIAAILSATAETVAGCPTIAVGDLSAGSSGPSLLPQTHAATLPTPAHEAYAIFTSGSTGRPKGVSVSQGNLAYHVAARDAAYPGAPNRILLLTFPLVFDGSVTGIFGTLCTGGTLVLPRPIEATDPDRLAALIRDQGVTQTIMIPSQWNLLLSAAPPGALASLRLAVVAGEACPRELVERHYSTLPDTPLANEYGPTETTVWATLERCAAGQAGPVPIGRPIPGSRAYVVDRHGRLCPPGVPGELLIAGPGVAGGYINQPELTAARFAANPFHNDASLRNVYRTGDRVVQADDGRLYFRGRMDDQVKVSGYRIELDEIGACLLQCPGVQEAVAVVHYPAERAAGMIVAHAAGADLPSQEAILRHAQRWLPAYMVPHSVMLHERLPHTASGKVDRRNLPAPVLSRTEPAAPEGEMEQAIAQAWQAALGHDSIGRFDDFFAIGGSSLGAMQIVSSLRRELKVAIDLTDLLESPRLCDFARQVAGRQARQEPDASIPRRQRTRIDLAASPGATQEPRP